MLLLLLKPDSLAYQVAHSARHFRTNLDSLAILPATNAHIQGLHALVIGTVLIAWEHAPSQT